MAATLQIDLPNGVRSKAKQRAADGGYSTLADYIIGLIEDDIRGHGQRAVKGRAKRVAVSREAFHKLRKRLLDGMMSNMKASEDPGYGYTCGYRLRDIDRCAVIIDAFHNELVAKPKASPDRVVDSVKRVVFKLNKLNAACGRALIETDQREVLCQLIWVAARNAGLTITVDITEPWREW